MGCTGEINASGLGILREIGWQSFCFVECPENMKLGRIHGKVFAFNLFSLHLVPYMSIIVR